MPDSIYTPTKEHFYVYLYCNPLKNDLPFYVGKGKGKRAFIHLWAKDASEQAKQNPHRHNTIKKIRRAELEPNLYCLWEGDSEESAFYLEKLFIAMFGRKVDGGSLCNISKGGEGNSGLIHSDETRAKMRAVNIGKRLTPEHRAKLSAASIGRRHTPEHIEKVRAANIGKKHSPETRAKLSAANLGKKQSPETRAKIGAAGIGRTLTPEHKAKLLAASRGRKVSPETRAKIAESGSKLWLVTFPDGHQEHIRNLFCFARQNTLRHSTLARGYTSKGFKAQRLPVSTYAGNSH